MTAIGIDTHKDTLAACASTTSGRCSGEATFANDPAGHAALAAWARASGAGRQARVRGLLDLRRRGRPVARAARVRPSARSRRSSAERERVRTRRAGKSDPGDALAIARVTAREDDLPPIRRADPTDRARPPARGPRRPRGRGDPGAQPAPRRPRRPRPGLWRPAPPTSSRNATWRPSPGAPADCRGSTPSSPASGSPSCAGCRPGVRALSRADRALVAGHPLLELPGVGPLTAAALRGRDRRHPAASGQPMRSRCWPAWRRSRPAPARPSGCASTGAATASSTGPST